MLSGCSDLHHEHITGRYYLVAIDTKETMSLCYSVNDDNSSFVDVIGMCVYSIGYNDKYIIAKQHPSNNRDTIVYYIVPIHKEFNYFPEKNVIGPLSDAQFRKTRKKLFIPDGLTFTYTIRSLE